MFAILWDRRARDEVARLTSFDRVRVVDEYDVDEEGRVVVVRAVRLKGRRRTREIVR